MPTSSQDAYVRTHPLTQDRIDNVTDHLEHSPYKNAKLDAKFYTMHERMKAKLLGYLQPETALLRYTDNDTRLPARYARAIALYRSGQADRALSLIDGLIREEPNNPFFYELKAQIQFDNGRVDASIGNYKRANDLLKDSALLRTAYGHALLESKDQSHLDLAIQNLQEANQLEGRDPTVWRFLAAAWGRKAEISKDTQYQGMATYALAEEAVAEGHDAAAGQLADRAMKGLRKGSPYWLHAQDIKLSTAPNDEKNDDKKSKSH